ncbi:drug/metabolite transporter (DMT)-like permease [Methanohalophilus levihalophilus]|uniref:DMT family transporter n=1 Tax=Methanohalophilus levihalophilus TaxID=1431282 RepID=UPI001AE68ACC|nr:DMT family transporter [Methanohalophilus levihalophilus]MBP2029113.1 drug/metabolite transporter (DMT)-like permease [Methanohalophilus levihalophilus]
MIPAEFLVVFFGLMAAASWGAGDFSGGFASKKANVYGVVLITQTVGVFLLAASAYLIAEEMPPIGGMIWGVVAGIFISIGLLALYHGLSQGKMGFVAPVSAVVAASVPVIFSAFYEGLPAYYQMLGFAFALVAVWLIAGGGEGLEKIDRSDLLLPLIAGTGFGLFFISIDRVSDTAVLWPLTAARIAAVVTLLAFIAYKGTVSAPSKSVLPIIIVAGIFDTGGNTFFALASQAGRLDIASITSSLYPAGTVLLAWLILKEKMTHKQWIGVLAALIAVILISS